MGWPNSNGELSSGAYIPREQRAKDEPYSDELAVLQGARGLVVVYRVRDHEKVKDHKVGTIQLCRSGRNWQPPYRPRFSRKPSWPQAAKNRCSTANFP